MLDCGPNDELLYCIHEYKVKLILHCKGRYYWLCFILYIGGYFARKDEKSIFF